MMSLWYRADGEVELIGQAGAAGADHGLDLGVREDLVEPGLLDVDDLAPQGQDGLEAPVAGLLGRTAGRVALHQVELARGWVADGAVGQLAGQRGVLQHALAPGEVAGLARRLRAWAAWTVLRDDLLGVGGVLLEELGELLVDDALHEAADLGVAQLGLGLALELRLAQLDAENGHQAFAHVLAAQVLLFLLQEALGAGVVVDGPREGGPEAGEVGAALVGVDVVGEGEHVVVVAGVPLHGQLEVVVGLLALEVDHPRMDGVLVRVDVLDEVDDAAVVAVDHRAWLGALPAVPARCPSRRPAGRLPLAKPETSISAVRSR